MSGTLSDSSYCTGLQQMNLVLTGHHLWLPHMPGGHSFIDLFLPLVRGVHWEAEVVEDQLQEELDELSVQIRV